MIFGVAGRPSYVLDGFGEAGDFGEKICGYFEIERGEILFDLALVGHADTSGRRVGVAQTELQRDEGGVDTMFETGLDDGGAGLFD